MDISKFRNMRQKPGILALAVKDTTAELLIYDVIGEDFFGDGVSAKGVVQQLKGMPDTVETVLVRINSPGGDVFDGVAIMNALLGFKGTVNVQIDGLCASAASVIAMAGKTISMAESSMLMVHNPWVMSIGDANDMRATADLLDKIRMGTMLPAYARSGMTAEQITAVMDAETWYTAAEAKEAGWVDAILELPAKPAAKAKYDLSAFKHPPAAIKADDACVCPCQPCMDGDCSQCSHEGCECDGCEDCPQMAAKATLTAAITAKAETDALEAAENARISAEMQQKWLIRAQRRAENLRLAAIS